jgi:ubiquinone/menaquinone biosynthesis C-methylase UbiE
MARASRPHRWHPRKAREVVKLPRVSERYVPAAGRPVLTPVFDAVNAVTMRQRRWRPLLVDRAKAAGARRILDLGCGTGAMAIALARDLPAAKVIGIDGDPAVLRRARAKAAKVGVELELHEALADAIPLADESVDCVVSTLVFHHLPADVKRRALIEARRVLVPGGRLLICDIGRSRDPVMRAVFFLVQLLDGFDATQENVEGKLPQIVAQSGFNDVVILRRVRTGGGSLDVIQAERTGEPARTVARAT